MSQLRILCDNSGPFHPYQQYIRDRLKAESGASALSFVSAIMMFERNDFHFLKWAAPLLIDVTFSVAPIVFSLLLSHHNLRFRVVQMLLWVAPFSSILRRYPFSEMVQPKWITLDLPRLRLQDLSNSRQYIPNDAIFWYLTSIILSLSNLFNTN